MNELFLMHTCLSAELFVPQWSVRNTFLKQSECKNENAFKCCLYDVTSVSLSVK